MNITAINGSPKLKASASESIIIQMNNLLGNKIKTFHAMQMTQSKTPQDNIANILDADILLIVFPLYVDSLPAHLIELLTRLETAASTIIAKPKIYSIVNCGFIEAEQTALALEMIKHFAARLGLTWGGGIGIGGGGMLSSIDGDWKKGPAGGIYRALVDMAGNIQNGENTQNIFISPKIPRFLYSILGNWMWKTEAKRNGVKSLRARPY